MVRFVVRRLAGLVATLLLASFAVYASVYAAPGSPLAALSGGRGLPPDAEAALIARFRLDEPFLARYAGWLSDAVTGDFGTSFVFRTDVADLLSSRVGTSLALVGLAGTLTLLAGVGLGVAAATRGRRTDRAVLATTIVGQAVPSFVAAMFLSWLFAVRLGWLPTIGSGTGFVDSVRHLTLPAVSLALSYTAYVARITRAATRDQLDREHVATARARGLSPRAIVRRHVVRNALVPISTVSFLSLAGLLATTVVVERAFNLDGLGSLLVEGVARKDFAVVQAVSLILVTVFVVINSLVDVLYGLLDPRIQIGATR